MIGFHAPATAPPRDPFFEPDNLRRIKSGQRRLIRSIQAMPLPGDDAAAADDDSPDPVETIPFPAPADPWTIEDLRRKACKGYHTSNFKYVCRVGDHTCYRVRLPAAMTRRGVGRLVGMFSDEIDGAYAAAEALNEEGARKPGP